jgi:hypothetical protein
MTGMAVTASATNADVHEVFEGSDSNSSPKIVDTKASTRLTKVDSSPTQDFMSKNTIQINRNRPPRLGSAHPGTRQAPLIGVSKKSSDQQIRQIKTVTGNTNLIRS